MREDEPEIARPFRQRHQDLIRLRADVHVVHPRNGLRFVDASHRAVDAAMWNGNHHDAGRGRLAPPVVRRFSERVPEKNLFERRQRALAIFLEPERPGAQAADRPRGDLENVDALIVDAALRVNRSMSQADRRGRARYRIEDVPLHRIGRRRGRDVDRLFEERTVEGVWLVEQRQRVEGAEMHDALERELPAFDEALDQDGVVRALVRHALGANIRRRQQRSQPLERLDEGRPVVDPHDAAAGGQR